MVIIKNAKIYTMAGKIIDNGYIASNDGKIIEVGESFEASALTKADGFEIIDAGGGLVFPGFIDGHCHVGMWEDSVGFEGEDGNESTDPVTPQLRAIDGIYHGDRSFVEARENGVTTVVTGPGSANVIGGQFAALKTYGRCVDEMVIKEPVAMKVAFGENPKTVYNEKRQAPMTRMATAAILRENLLKAREYKEMLDEYEGNKEEHDKPEFDIKLEALLKVLNKEIPLKAHAHRADDIITALRIAKEFDVNITIEHCTEGHLIKDLLKEANVPVIVGPILMDRSKIELRNFDMRTPKELCDEGLMVSLMTDHPVVPIQHLWLCAAMACREGMDEMKALEAITINPAKACGISDRVGSLEVGKDADIVIFDGHPFDMKSKVTMTLINGSVVYKR